MSKNHHRYDRRAFLSKSLSGAASLGLMGVTTNSLSFTRPDAKPVIYRDLGKTGIKVPIVSMGVYTTNPALIKEAFEAGVRHFSTAHYYQRGLCEKTIGDAFQDLKVRKDVILATKIHSGKNRDGTWPEHIKGQYLKQFSLSLERLQTDHLDILYLYNVRSPDELEKAELVETLTELKQQQKIRCVGFTIHTNHVEILNTASELKFFDAAVVAFNYSMSQNDALLKALARAAQAGIGLVAMKTQCGSAWGVDGYRKPADQLKNHTAMLKWVLSHNFISTAIPAMEAFEHVEENFSVAYDLDYTDEEIRFLESENARYGMAFCQQCQKCVATCPHGVDIPTLMRTHMYAYQYSNMDLVNLAREEMGTSKGIAPCLSCEKCQAICPNSLPISSNISDLKKLNWKLFA